MSLKKWRKTIEKQDVKDYPGWRPLLCVWKKRKYVDFKIQRG
jgi:hypothetical protein